MIELVRYAVQGAIDRATSLAVEMLGGGMAFIRSPEVSYLLAAARVLSLHPPARLTGTSMGIGRACAVRFAGPGYRIFAGVRKMTDGEAFKAHGSGTRR